MKVFLDTNVVVDFLGERDPFFQDAAKIFELWRKEEIRLSLSVLTIVNCAYILHKAYSKETMLDKIKWLCGSFEIAPIDVSTIVGAVDLGEKDFEDSVQYLSASSIHSDVIITRDKKGFANADIPVMTPAEFLERSRQQRNKYQKKS